MPDFADFLAPFDPIEFKARYFARQPVHLRAEGRKRDNPLPWQRLNELLALTPYWNEDTLKVYFRSREALRDNYCDVSDLVPGARAPADPRKVRALIGLGASLVANSIHRVCPQVDAWCRALQREFAASAGANIYCSFQHVQAFNTHFDLHDVFAFQAEGEKRWTVYESRADNPTTALPPGDDTERWLTESRGKVLFQADMKPGDILYLPRGQYHDALTGAGASLHITYWVKPATGQSLFKLLEAATAHDSAFRAFLPDARDTPALAAHVQALSKRLDELLNAPSFRLDIENHQRGLARDAAEYTLPQQVRPQFYSPLKRAPVARRRDDFVAIVDGREVSLGAAGSAVAWLMQQRLFSLEDLAARFPSVGEERLRATLARLVAAGAIVETEMK
jgi:hypothetical protein